MQRRRKSRQSGADDMVTYIGALWLSPEDAPSFLFYNRPHLTPSLRVGLAEPGLGDIFFIC